MLRMVGQVEARPAPQMRWTNRWLQIAHLAAGYGGQIGTAEICASILRKVGDPRAAWLLP